MDRACVTLQSKSNPELHITVQLKGEPAPEYRPPKRAPSNSSWQIVNLKYPQFETTQTAGAAEIAWQCGILYAYGQVNPTGERDLPYTAFLEEISGVLDGSFDPCALAAAVGIAYLAHHQGLITQEKLEDKLKNWDFHGWELLECKINGVPCINANLAD